jgi:hypothetical protein
MSFKELNGPTGNLSSAYAAGLSGPEARICPACMMINKERPKLWSHADPCTQCCVDYDAGNLNIGRRGSDEVNFELKIRDNIQLIQQNMRNLNEQVAKPLCPCYNSLTHIIILMYPLQLERASRHVVSKKALQSMQDTVRQAQQMVQDTENCFRK